MSTSILAKLTPSPVPAGRFPEMNKTVGWADEVYFTIGERDALAFTVRLRREDGGTGVALTFPYSASMPWNAEARQFAIWDRAQSAWIVRDSLRPLVLFFRFCERYGCRIFPEAKSYLEQRWEDLMIDAAREESGR
jgi:hypothetical protein